MDPSSLPLAAAAFVLAAWAVIGNDSLQTLGPFLQANRGRTPRTLQALFLCLVLCAVLLLGWWQGAGDVSWGRLDTYPPRQSVGWLDLLPPLAVLLLTQLGAPVSTSFLVLTAFSPANLPALLRRSLHGYGLALVVALLAYGAMALWRRHLASGALLAGVPGAAAMSVDPPREPPAAVASAGGEPADPPASSVLADPAGIPVASLLPPVFEGFREFGAASPTLAAAASAEVCPNPDCQQPGESAALLANREAATAGTLAEGPTRAGSRVRAQPCQLPMATGMVSALLLQWIATGWLWSQWLIQDLANIFVTLPRQLGGGAMALCLAVLCAGVCLLVRGDGGAIQTILRRKSGLEEPLANTILSLLYGMVLAVLASWGREPLSTTWVFLGLLAGRELGLRLAPEPRPLLVVALDLGRDLALASLGLAISLAVASAVQPLRLDS